MAEKSLILSIFLLTSDFFFFILKGSKSAWLIFDKISDISALA